MTQDTNTASGAADLPEALRPVEPVALIASIQELNAWEARADGELLTPAEGESIILVLHELKRLLALAAGQATAAQQGAAYAALPEPITYQIAVLKACEHGDALVGWRVEPSRQSFDASMRPKRKLYTEGDMHDFADRTHTLRASRGQASSQAGEYPALVCDYCGALTPDPWHSSGMLHGKMSKHIHSCDACAARGAADAQAAKQQEQLI